MTCIDIEKSRSTGHAVPSCQCSTCCRRREAARDAQRRFHNKNPDYDWHEKNPERAQEIRFKSDLKKRGISPDEYNRLLSEQEGVCKICRQVCPTGRRLAVDHNHETGKVRALLCTNCNHGLGKFKDSPGLLKIAAAYLEDYK